jgi:acid stress-induced BolA-like protein IbaG/YrbA
MTPETIRKMIQEQISDCQVEMSGADCSFTVIVTSPQFEGKSPLERHRMVNDIFKSHFESGELHALSIKTKVA